MQPDHYALGQALKSLRKARDLGQKAVVSRLGEAIGERTLRAYESGARRPSRDRLLRLMTRSLGVRNATEINRHLQMAGYVILTDEEISEFKMESGLTKGDADRAIPELGTPTDFRVEVSTLVVSDGQGRELWRHQFPTRLAQAAYDDQNVVKRCSFADIDQDGRIEILFVHTPLNFGSVGTTLVCFSESGAIRWEFVPGKEVRDSTGRDYCRPYFISNVQLIPQPRSKPHILVSSNHYLHNPDQIAMLDSLGALISEYWHSGHLLHVAHADLNGDGVEEILLGGVNNGYRQATIVIFDARYVSGASAQPGRQLLGFPQGSEKAVVLFPKTCVAMNVPYNRVTSLWVTSERRIVAVTAEGVSEGKNAGVMIYEFDFDLNIVNARPDSHLQESHRLLEIEGSLDHSWTEDENERLKTEVVVKGTL